MATPPANQVPMISPAEMQILVSRTGLVLNPGQVADLVLAWRQVAGLIGTLPRARPMADDMALTFRLPPPKATEPAPEARDMRLAPRSAAKPIPAGKAARKPERTAVSKRLGRTVKKR